ncbi:MAG: hypothetical protein IAF02_14310 [Anaerolineae bacterium]|nr:hypothetical protein [Anaerolineae bacterium]
MNQSQQKPLFRINEYMTKTTWLHAEDALHLRRDDNDTPIPKIRLFAGLYNRGEGANAQLAHWLDAADARVIFADLSWGKAVDFVDYKGTNGSEPESRVLRINTKDDKVFFQLTKGPGKPTPTGAIMPAGPVAEKVNVGMTKNEARKMAYAVLEHMAAYATAQIVAAMQLPTAAIATKQKPKLTIEEADEALDDLFGGGIRKPRVTEQTHRGRVVRSNTTTETAPSKIDGQLVYRNGQPVEPGDLPIFQEYQAAHRGEAPFSRETATGWFYR